MTLRELIDGLEVREIRGDDSVEIIDIAYHSQKVAEGSLFIAIKGLKVDGHDFIPEAIERGARTIILEDLGRSIQREIPAVTVSNSRKALSLISAKFFRHPSIDLKLIGVTGTNGKTTTTFLIESILKEGGFNPGVIGTINYRLGGEETVAMHTTPESLDLQRILHQMLGKGATHAVMEVSSHALDQGRVEGCSFEGAVFTNLTPEHLDYHGDMNGYFKSKEKLFTSLLRSEGFAVINCDDEWGEIIYRNLSINRLRYGIRKKAEVGTEEVTFSQNGITAKACTPAGVLTINSPLVGEINLYNILAAVCVGIIQGIPLDLIESGIEKVKRVPGRLEQIANDRGLTIFVDYAHTSDALKRVLLTLKGLSRRRIITIFGCGGDRDRTKRPLMGEISGRYSDITIITSDNPRSEDPLKIIGEIEEGIKKLGMQRCTGECERGYLVMPDRKEAIVTGIKLSRAGDVILIAGKGHENYQIIREKRVHFDDREEAINALKALA
jgi:UDP-N-acetylmuramoyl-L-alanyl-D-glutamate--2,6-diaminopimelate ligase